MCFLIEIQGKKRYGNAWNIRNIVNEICNKVTCHENCNSYTCSCELSCKVVFEPMGEQYSML